MRLVLEVESDKRIVILVIVGSPCESLHPYIGSNLNRFSVIGSKALAVPQAVVVTGIVRLGAVNINENLDTVLLALLKQNIENLLAAAAAVWGEVPVEAIQKVGSTFTGVEHRIEPVRTLDGVLYYNDSIGTSPTRTIAGLRSFNQKVILIAGGYDKHIPYEPLAPEVVAHVKNLVLMGATGPRIEKAVREDPGFNEAELPIQHADNMQHAVELARACAKPGDIIILSPASASFDLYPNFEVRGREFKKIVNELK